MRLSLILQAVDRITSPIRRVAGAVRRFTRDALARLRREGSLVSRVMAGMGRAARAAAGAVGRATISIGRGLGRIAARAASAAAGLASTAAAAGVLAGGIFVAGVIRAASAFEQFQVILENTEGSAEAARRAMDWVKDFAKTTPYEVEQVMEAFVRLKAYGMEPTNGMLRSLGNTASGMGKQLMDAVEMIADASTGEFERVKEFGIKAKVAGDKVTFAYTKNGKALKKTAKNNALAIQEALRAIMDERFAGMMDRQSRTFAGLWSNLMDQVTAFQLAIADAGFFDSLKGKLQEVLDYVNRMAANGQLQKWAESVSAGFEAVVEFAGRFVRETDWQQVGSDLQAVAGHVWRVVQALAAAIRWSERLRSSISNSAFGKWWAWQASIYGKAIDFVMPGGGSAKPAPPSNDNAGRPASPAPASNDEAGGPASPARGRETRPRTPEERLPNFAPPRPSPLKPGAAALRGSDWPTQTTQTAEVGGRIDIRVSADGGATAQVTRISSFNREVPINVSRGWVANVA